MRFMLLQAYGGVEADVPPMSEWKPEEVEAHIRYQRDLNDELRERGELVDAQALTARPLPRGRCAAWCVTTPAGWSARTPCPPRPRC